METITKPKLIAALVFVYNGKSINNLAASSNSDLTLSNILFSELDYNSIIKDCEQNNSLVQNIYLCPNESYCEVNFCNRTSKYSKRLKIPYIYAPQVTPILKYFDIITDQKILEISLKYDDAEVIDRIDSYPIK
jgi:hypothetical protein